MNCSTGKSVSREVDVLVVGGGIAGAFAALGARAKGVRVTLIERHNVLGGQGTAGGVAGFCGDSSLVNGPFAELVERLQRRGSIKPYDPNKDRRGYELDQWAFYLQEYLLEQGVKVQFHTQMVDATCRNGTLHSVLASTPSDSITYRPRMAIDATGECVLAHAAGFETFHEGPYVQLPMSLYFTLWDTGSKVEPYLPPKCPKWESYDDIPMTTVDAFPSGKVEVKMKVVGFDAADGDSLSAAEVAARRQMMGLIYFLQTKGYRGRVYDRHALACVSRQIGIREGRRVVGTYVITEEDVKRRRLFEDAVAVGTYHLDYHWPEKPQRAGTGITTHLEAYHIPLGCLIPKGSKNLLVAGRGISGDQMAMSSYRVMTTCAQTGFAAGRVAYECLRKGLNIRKAPIQTVQKGLIRAQQSLNLSDYGSYLRKKTCIHEHIFGDERPFPQCHASSLVQLSNDRYLAVWFGGTREGHEDTAIWSSMRSEEAWSPPVMVAKVAPVPHYNPVLFRRPDGRIMLFFKAGQGATNWATWVMSSRDEGVTWTRPREFIKGSPFGRGPVKNKPIVLSDGTWLAPGSTERHEVHGWEVFIDRSEDEGCSWSATKVDINRKRITGLGAIQPALWEWEPGKVSMFVRTACGVIGRSDSKDYGRTWTRIRPTKLLNPNSGIDAAMIDEGVLALVYNPSSTNKIRTPLTIALSFDNGRTWPRRRDIESGEGSFAYPAIIPVACGMAITYTWNRLSIGFWKGSIEQIPEVL